MRPLTPAAFWDSFVIMNYRSGIRITSPSRFEFLVAFLFRVVIFVLEYVTLYDPNTRPVLYRKWIEFVPVIFFYAYNTALRRMAKKI